MKKLSLKLEELSVESFDTASTRPDRRGTVQARVGTIAPDYTCNVSCLGTCALTCWNTCPNSCQGTCYITCAQSCVGTCENTCGQTCTCGAYCI